MTTVEKQLQVKYDYSEVSQTEIDSQEHEKFEEDYSDIAPTIGKRHVQVGLYFILGFVAFSFRVSLSVGIVAMMDPSVSSNPNIVTYPEWKKKNIILASFFCGYMIPQIFAAYAAKKFGAKWFLVGTMFTQSCLSILMPFTAAIFGEIGMILSRVLEGFCQGFVIPSCIHLLSQWVPPQERSRLGSVVFTGGKLGTVFSIFMTGVIAGSQYGWPWSFRCFGCLGILWCLFMSIFGYNSPRDHPKITEAERLYIERSLGHDNKHHKTPWKAIFTSAPVWALFVALLGQNYSFWTLQTQMPSYLKNIMKFDIKKNGLFSSIPYLAMFTMSYVFGFISDALINKGILTRTTARKTFNSIGFLVPAATIAVLAYTRSDQSTQAVAMNIVALGVSSACYSGYAINAMDLSPNHAGMIMGLLNGVAHISAVTAPLVVQLVVTNQTDIFQWRIVFLIAAGSYTVAAIIFVVFGSGKVQKWNNEENINKEP